MTRRGCLRHNARRDANEEGIVQDLLRCGCTVQRLSGKALPDLLVGYQGENYLLEVKTDSGKSKPHQLGWAAEWRGRKPRLVRSAEEALRALGAIPEGADGTC